MNIDHSDPYIDGLDVPSEAPPGTDFSVSVSIGNRSEIIAPQDGTCQSGIFATNVAWRTPVRILVDGEEVFSTYKCIDGSSGTKSVTTQLSPGTGQHTVTAEVLEAPQNTVAERRAATVTVSEDASDPAIPSTGDKVTEWLGKVADALGGTTQQVAFGALLAVILLVVV